MAEGKITLIFDEENLQKIMENKLSSSMAKDSRYMGVANDGGLVVVSFSKFNGIDGEVAVVAAGANPPLFAAGRKILRYCFDICNCRRVTALIYKDNKRAIKLSGLFGFRREGTLRRAGLDGEDVVVMGLLAAEYGKRRRLKVAA